MSEWVRVCPADDLPDRGCRTAFVAGGPVAVRRLGDELFAIQNVCPHQGGPLGEGDLEGHTITCPMHAWTFDLRTGQHVANAIVRVKTFPIRIREGWIEVGSAPAPPAEPPLPPPLAKPPPAPAPTAAKKPFWRFGR